MPTTMLIGLDESPFSSAAVEYGIALANRFGCMLVGLGIVDEPTIRGPQSKERMAASYQGAYQQMMSEAGHRVDRILERFSLRCTAAGVSHKLLENVGHPCEQIALEAQRYDLILMGRRTFFHFETSNAACETLERLLHRTPRPVVVVPEEPRAGEGVLVAYDGNASAARALQAFAASGLASLGNLHVLCAHEQSHVEASKLASRAIEYLRFHELAATPHGIASQRGASEDILELAQSLGVGLIVMGAYGRGAVKEFFLGSVTRCLLEKTPVPLFLYH